MYVYSNEAHGPIGRQPYEDPAATLPYCREGSYNGPIGGSEAIITAWLPRELKDLDPRDTHRPRPYTIISDNLGLDDSDGLIEIVVQIVAI